MMAEFRRASNEFKSTIESEVEAEKIRESMRIEPPRVDPVSSPPAAAAGDPYGEPPAPEPQPAEPAPVPDTVSRQPDDTPIEPK
jgi:hypothetical protein